MRESDEPDAAAETAPLSGEVGSVVSRQILAGARRVGPDVEPGSAEDAEPLDEPEPEPWDIPPPPPSAPRLREQSLDEVLARLNQLTLREARALLRAYRLIPRAELVFGGWAPVTAASERRSTDPPSLDQIVSGRANLREGAIREARANGAQVDADAVTARARDVVVDALSHATLSGGGIEEATLAAAMAAQDTALAFTVRPWISDWRFQELVEPWAKGFSVIAVEANSFDILGVIALGFGVMALFSLGVGRTSLDLGNVFGLLFAFLTATVLAIRWHVRRQPAPIVTLRGIA